VTAAPVPIIVIPVTMTFSSNAPANTKHWQQSMELAAVHI